MKLVRYGAVGQEKPGLIDRSGRIRDLSAQVKDITGEALSAAGLAKLAALDPASLPLVDGNPRLGAPVGSITKFVAIGLNYADHAAEAGMALPSEPIVFIKANTSLCGPNDNVEKPRGSTKLDWEVELAIIIGTKAKYVSEADALKHVAGYAVCNDVSERFFQIERGGNFAHIAQRLLLVQPAVVGLGDRHHATHHRPGFLHRFAIRPAACADQKQAPLAAEIG